MSKEGYSAGEGGGDMIPRFLACARKNNSARKVEKSREGTLWSMLK